MTEDLKRITSHSKSDHLPAFTLNTTAAETGGRFLLANYVNETGALNGVVPAESFLAAYGNGETKGKAADLHLMTAARLSATFPYVSSAARIEGQFDYGADHFVDGGYFDNDGASSAIEFLTEVFNHGGDPKGAVPILFIEIRDGSDLDIDHSEESYENQNKTHLNADSPPKVNYWNMFSQLTAPLGAFWRSGHVSITRRNRRELELLMTQLANQNKAVFTHIVFDYQDPPHLPNSSSL